MTTQLNLHDEIPDGDEMKLADNPRALAFRNRIATPATAPATPGATVARPAAPIATNGPATPPRP